MFERCTGHVRAILDYFSCMIVEISACNTFVVEAPGAHTVFVIFFMLPVYAAKWQASRAGHRMHGDCTRCTLSCGEVSIMCVWTLRMSGFPIVLGQAIRQMYK